MIDQHSIPHFPARTKDEVNQSRPFDRQIPVHVVVVRESDRFTGPVDLEDYRPHMSTGIVAAPHHLQPRRYRGPLGGMRRFLEGCGRLMAEAERVGAGK